VLKTSIIVFVLLFASFGVRVFHIGHDGLTRNETLTLLRVNGISGVVSDNLNVTTPLPDEFTHQQLRDMRTYAHVVEATIDDSGNAIGYNIMLYQWTKLFGNTNTSLRMMSLLFGVLTVILGYYFCRQLFNERTANIAAILLCLHPVLIEYAQLARSYVPATFFILLSTYSLYQVSVAKKHTWLHIPLYIIALNFSLWMHYVTIYVFVSHVLLVALFHSHRKALIQYALMAIVGFGIFSIWLFNGGWEGKRPMNIERSMWQHNVMVNGDDPGYVSELSDSTYQVIMNFVRIFGNDLEPASGKNYGFFLLLLLPFAIVFFVFLKVRKSEFFRPVMFVTFPLIMYIVFVIFMVLRTGHTIPFDIRYTTFVMPFACLLLAFGFDRMINLDRRLVWPAYSLIIVVMIVMIAGIFPGLLRQRNHVRITEPFMYHNAADFIEAHADKSCSITFQNKEDAILTNLYVKQDIPCIQRIDPSIEKNRMVIQNGTTPYIYTFTGAR
jgi:uncharacterized membrane protein